MGVDRGNRENVIGNTIEDTTDTQYTIWNIQYTIWNIQYTIYSAKYTIWNMEYGIYMIQRLYTIYYTHIQYTIHNTHIQYTITIPIYNTQYTLYIIHYTLYIIPLSHSPIIQSNSPNISHQSRLELQCRAIQQYKRRIQHILRHWLSRQLFQQYISTNIGHVTSHMNMLNYTIPTMAAHFDRVKGMEEM